MGMYTEIIFGASLKESTPMDVIGTINVLITGDIIPACFKLDTRLRWLLKGGSDSFYFGSRNNPPAVFVFNDISKTWALTFRGNIKNYDNEIEEFLNWIKPWIEKGSGTRDMYAIVTYEEAEEPTIFYAR